MFVIFICDSSRIIKINHIVKNFFGREPHKGVNPDEVVAAGAAIQAGVLQGDVKDILLLDVTPLSLGIETLGGVMTKLIDRNTTIPTRKSQVFSTAADNQTSVEVHVLQGEREMASGNRTLGKFVLDGIPTSPRGVPQVEVSFDIDSNGIVHVGAKDLATHKEQKIRIESSSGLAKDEVEKIVKEASSHEAEDKKYREEVEIRNQADALVYSTEKTLNENRTKLPVGELKKVEEALEACKKAIELKEAAKIKQTSDTLMQASHKIAEILYKKQAEEAKKTETPPKGSGTDKGNGSDKKEDNVVDA